MATGAVALSSCGGSGTTDESGSLTEFLIQPTEITVSAPAGAPTGSCPGGGSLDRVFVYGGTAPYRLDNTSPSFVQLDKSTVESKGGSFGVTFLGGCVDKATIVVVDHLDRQVILTVTGKAAE